jgi:hypothetical protein
MHLKILPTLHRVSPPEPTRIAPKIASPRLAYEGWAASIYSTSFHMGSTENLPLLAEQTIQSQSNCNLHLKLLDWEYAFTISRSRRFAKEAQLLAAVSIIKMVFVGNSIVTSLKHHHQLQRKRPIRLHSNKRVHPISANAVHLY